MSLSAPINPLIFPCCIGAEGPSPASCAVSFQPPHLHLTLTRLPSCQSSRDVFDRIFACHHYMEACRAWKWGCNIFLGRHRHPKKNAVRGKAYCRVVESVIEKSSIDAIWIVCVHTRNQNWIVLLWLADTGCQEKERMYESVSIFTMYDRQATTFLSHRLGAGAGAAALQSLWPSPPQLHWRSGRLQWCLNPTGSDPWRHARSTAGGVAFMARCGRKKKAHNWQGCVMCHDHVIGIQMGLPLFYSIQSAFLIISGHFKSFSQQQSSLPLPGFGIGPKLSAMVGGMMRASGQRFFAKTSNQALGGSLGITRSMWSGSAGATARYGLSLS